MSGIMVKIPRAWSEQLFAQRINRIVDGSHSHGPYEHAHGHGTWQLDDHNDWFMSVTDGIASIRYRHNKTPQQWAALRTVIEMFIK